MHQIQLQEILRPFLPLLPWFGLLLLFGLFLRWLKSPEVKGRIGEWAVSKGALRKLDPQIYRIFEDLYVPKSKGEEFAQIDHVVLSEFGIFVIETKNYGGWIFGDADSYKWTQTFPGKKTRFYNPLRQNAVHVRALQQLLDLPDDVFHSVVYFIGDSEFKTPMPDNVIRKGLRKYIERRREKLLSPEQFAEAERRMVTLGNGQDKKAVQRQHIRNCEQRKAA
ncbi:MAG: restriction system protein [Verrucomicrobiales bacterium]|jgi:restriction system protein